MTTTEMLLRMGLAVLVSGFIGFDREVKNRPAGIRTHILVCIGATIIAMIQENISATAFDFAQGHPEFQGIVRADESRLIAQVVSGIGFLGAGTIIVTKQSVQGLTTAASLWAVAGLGLAIGMGFYHVGLLGTIVILLVLSVLNRMIRMPEMRRLEISYHYSPEMHQLIHEAFEKQGVVVKDYMVSIQCEQPVIYKDSYLLEVPVGFSREELLATFLMHSEIQSIRLRSN